MARVTVEDCVDKVPNRFELVLLAVHRARALANGSHITIDAENDKNAVIALREIAERMIDPADAREGLVHAMQQNAETDEPEPAAAPESPRVLHSLGRDDPSTDTVVDVITEQDLLRGMEKFGPLETATKLTEGQGS